VFQFVSKMFKEDAPLTSLVRQFHAAGPSCEEFLSLNLEQKP